MRTWFVVWLTGLGLALIVPANAQDSASAALCDTAAASPFQQDRPAGVPGVPSDQVDPKIAIPACEAAAAAAPNDARIAFQLARAYFAAKSYAPARAQLANADKLGYPLAAFSMGLMYANGVGVGKDDAQAAIWFRKGADQGNALAQGALGYLYANGSGIAKDEAQAVSLYRKAADQGNAEAQAGLGYMYLNGNGVAKDEAQAVVWYRKAADQGNADAQAGLGYMYLNGNGVAKDEAQAVVWYRKAADQGNADAQARLGYMYVQGIGVAQDEAQAMIWFGKAAAQGDAAAQDNLGVAYASGQGVATDEAQAVLWFRKAADQGDADAQYHLGDAYAKGSGLGMDKAQAAIWYRKAADQGNAAAQTALALMQEHGQGVAKDAAADQGNQAAQKSIELQPADQGAAIAPGRRVALVIGIGAYKTVPELANPTRDAADIAAELSGMGFDVTHLDNLDELGLRKALRDFEKKADGASIALVYYAGHGMEVGGVNYLIPADAELDRDTHVDDEAVSLTRVLDAIDGARDLRLVLLDACRNNPFLAKITPAGSRAVNRGLARVEPGSSTLVAFSAKDGTTAEDGDGRNSPFAAALLANLKTRGVEINFLFRRVRDEVMADTGNRQEPFVYGSLSSVPIYLAGQ